MLEARLGYAHLAQARDAAGCGITGSISLSAEKRRTKWNFGNRENHRIIYAALLWRFPISGEARHIRLRTPARFI
jgi:hypothetical protein